MLYIGIDLGTTNSCCYYSVDGSLTVLQFNGKHLVPSFVDWRKNGSIEFGHSAKKHNDQSLSSSTVIHAAKRIIGKKYDHPMVNFLKSFCLCPIVNQNGRPVFKIESLNITVSPREVATHIIKHIISTVEAKTGQKTSKVCVTIPAHFGNDERVETVAAVVDAGIPEECVVIQNEPTAASYAYAIDNNVHQGRLLVYDFGGGTFDVSIVEFDHGDVHVKRYEGNPELGGSDIDCILLQWIEELYLRKYGQPLIPLDTPLKIRARHRRCLLAEVQECKRDFSSHSQVEFSYKFIGTVKTLSSDDDDENFTLVLDRNEFCNRIRSKVEETMDVVRKALRLYGITANDIDKVLLVGGSSRLTLVHDRLKELFGNKVIEHMDPDECVAKGACQYLLKPRAIKEIIAYSLDKEIKGNRVLCVIPRQSELPAECTVKTFTACDYQERVDSHIIQGNLNKTDESVPFNDRDFKKLNPYSFTGFEIRPEGEVEFNTTFRIEESGIVYVTVEEIKTHKILLDHKKITYM